MLESTSNFMKNFWPRKEGDVKTFKIQYVVDVDIKCEDAEKKAFISRTRQKIKRAVFDSPDDVKPTKIQIKFVD